MTDDRTAGDVLAAADAVLLDFDGPICTVFAGISDFEVSNRLRDVLRANGVPLTDTIARHNDPLAVLQYAATAPPDVLVAVEHQLQRSEAEAVKLAATTPHALEFIKAVHASGKGLAIVSNNSEAAIRTYLVDRGVSDFVKVISGRANARPDLMKPHPYSVLRALVELEVDHGSAVMIGDSVTDIEVSVATRIESIGFANKPGKAGLLAEAGATACVVGNDGMAVLLAALVQHLGRVNDFGAGG